MRDSINGLIKNLKEHQLELEKFEFYTEFDRGLFTGNIQLLERIIFELSSILPNDYELIKMENKLVFQDLGIRKLNESFKCKNGWSVACDLYPQIDVKNQIIYLRGTNKECDDFVTIINCEDNKARDELFDEITTTLKEYNFHCDWGDYINTK